MQQDPWPERRAWTVAEVADYGTAQGLEVYPQLVASPGEKFECYQGSSIRLGQDTVSAYCPF